MSPVLSEIRRGNSAARDGRILMYIRCAQCGSSTQVPPASVGRDVACETCGHTHSLERAHLLGSTPLERHERILEYSDAHSVDLASACSILLGILSPKDAINVRDSRESRAETPREQDAACDPGFARAIAEGLITRSEALRRGNRRAYASGIAQRHKLPLPAALLVADNRISLERALSRNAAATSTDALIDERAVAMDTPAERKRWKWLLLPVLVVLGVLLLLDHQRRHPTQADDAKQAVGRIDTRDDTTPLTSTEPVVQKDPADAVARITASHPRDVLVAFCELGAHQDPRTPLRVEPASNGWMGVYEEAGRTFRLFIQRNQQDARLFSTDGRQPIEITANSTFDANRLQ